MADVAASVLARLKNKAKESGLRTIKTFLTKPFTAVVRDKKFTEQWSAANGGWM